MCSSVVYIVVTVNGALLDKFASPLMFTNRIRAEEYLEGKNLTSARIVKIDRRRK